MGDIINAAEDLVEEIGDDFTIDQLAEAAGVSRSTIYRRHGGREGVLDALAERGIEVARTESARTRVLAAVTEIVGREGNLDATVDEIAARAGVSSMTVFRLFGDKESLLREFVESVTPRRITIPALQATDAPMVDVLTRVATTTLTFARAHPGLLKIGLARSRQHDALVSLHRSQGTTREALVGYFDGRAEAGEIDAEGGAAPAAYFAAMVLAEAMVVPAMGGVALSIEDAAARAVERFMRAFGAANE